MYAQFEKDGYRLYVNDDSSSTISDLNHMYLFDFLYYKLEPIEPLLDQYLTEQFDFTQMCLKDDRPAIVYQSDYEQAQRTNALVDLTEYEIPNTYLQRILSVLEKSHPFYSINDNAIKEAEAIVVDGFNIKAGISEYVMEKKKYGGILAELLTVSPFPPYGYWPPHFGESKIEIERYYKDYLETYEKCNTVRRMIKKGIVIMPPRLGILETHRQLKDLLVELLDQTQSVCESHKKMPPYEFMINLKVRVIDGIIYEQYSIGSLRQLLECELYHMVIEKIKIKKCKYCNAYFVYDDNRNQYCERRIEGDKTCQEVGPNRVYWNQRKNDDSYKALRKASAKNSMRLNRGVITSEQFQYWREQAEVKRKTDSDDYFEWLELAIPELREASSMPQK